MGEEKTMIDSKSSGRIDYRYEGFSIFWDKEGIQIQAIDYHAGILRLSWDMLFDLSKRAIQVDGSSQEADDKERKTILVVDIEPAEAIARFLQKCGYDTLVAEDTMIAWRMYLRVKPDLVITYIRMPGMCGLELSKKIKKRGTPVILTSGYRDESIRAKAFSLGVDVYLNKPFNLEDLKEHVARLLGEPSE